MKRLSIISIFIFLIIMAGCRPAGVVVKERPVAPVIVVKPPRPYSNYVWVEGGWVRTGNHYKYKQGYWAPPRKRAYRSGHWRQTRGGWVWVPGR